MKKWIKRIVKFIVYCVFAFIAFVLLVILGLWGEGKYYRMQLLDGKSDYEVSKKVDEITGKERISIYCNFWNYPPDIPDQELEEAVIKTVLRIRKENPGVDVIEIHGRTGYMDLLECAALYKKQEPREISFQNWGLIKNDTPKYRKTLRLPSE